MTTRFREETREPSSRRDSLSRDSGIGSIRENSILDTGRRDRDGSLTRLDGSGRRDLESRLSAINVAESLADLRNKYVTSLFFWVIKTLIIFSKVPLLRYMIN